jgi:kynurenine formamidase
MNLLLLTASLCLGIALGGCASGGTSARYIDLTHPMPTFDPAADASSLPDLAKPMGGSKAIPSFFPQAVFQPSTNLTNEGHFFRGRLSISEHHGTHVDAPSHYVNSKATTERGAVPTKFQHDLTLDDLIGPIVYVDISQRVRAELGKNDGRPSPDIGVTNFSDSSPNNVTAADLDAVADRLQNRSWIIVNTGWAKFFSADMPGDMTTSPYINGWNFPGVSRAAIDRLIEIEDRKGIRINGIAIDNIGVDDGESERGQGPNWDFSYRSHVRGMQRGWKFVENLANVDSLALVNTNTCTLIIGGLPIIGGSGSPARVIVACNE